MNTLNSQPRAFYISLVMQRALVPIVLTDKEIAFDMHSTSPAPLIRKHKLVSSLFAHNRHVVALSVVACCARFCQLHEL